MLERLAAIALLLCGLYVVTTVANQDLPPAGDDEGPLARRSLDPAPALVEGAKRDDAPDGERGGRHERAPGPTPDAMPAAEPTDPAPDEPTAEEPAPTEPAPTEPVPGDAAPPSEPVPEEPAPSDIAPEGPAPSEPVPEEPAPSEPAPPEPAPAEPTPTEPTPP